MYDWERSDNPCASQIHIVLHPTKHQPKPENKSYISGIYMSSSCVHEVTYYIVIYQKPNSKQLMITLVFVTSKIEGMTTQKYNITVNML